MGLNEKYYYNKFWSCFLLTIFWSQIVSPSVEEIDSEVTCDTGELLLTRYSENLSLVEPSQTLHDDIPFVAFSECSLEAQPLNLNTAFNEESLSQILAGDLMPYLFNLPLFSLDFTSSSHLFSVFCQAIKPS